MKADLEHLDVIIVGAGLSGIGGAYYLQKKLPGKSYAILENRDRVGGTWDLFRYPGIRSDSDMLTMGYSFKPWVSDIMISEGHLIRDYIEETAKEFNIHSKIRFKQKVLSASWSSDKNLWTLDVQIAGQEQKIIQMTCKYLILTAGYYKYDEGYRPDFAGMDRFKGPIVHPNQWPEDLNYEDKNVIVIGSGATAVTLVPNLAKKARHVTMVQRSPTYMVSMPARSVFVKALLAVLPDKLAYRIARGINIFFQDLFVRFSRMWPEFTKRMFIGWIRKDIGDKLANQHFKPRYNPWEQRACLTPDGDIFESIKTGKASIETDEIETFTESGVKLKSGKDVDADIIVTATGFNLQFQGGIRLTVDQKPIEYKDVLSYKGFMISNVPNLFYVFGYFFASWTLKLDAAFSYIFKIINRMEKNKNQKVIALLPSIPDKTQPIGAGKFTPGYLMRSRGEVPGELGKPWASNQMYIPDLFTLKYASTNAVELEYK